METGYKDWLKPEREETLDATHGGKMNSTKMFNGLLIVVLEKTLESPLDNQEIKPVNPKGNQPWIFAGRTDAKAEAPMPWPPDGKSLFIGKDPDAGKNLRQEEEEGAIEDEMVG